MRKERIFSAIAFLIIFSGMALRLYVYFQNRNLMVDELNVVRNIYERSFIGLLSLLDYEQFAPPGFLWMLKVCSLLFGFSEKAMRLYPLLASFASIWLLYKLCKRLGLAHLSFMALSMFCFSAFIIRYSTDVKQYLPDAMIALALVYMALIIDFNKGRNSRAVLIWSIFGSLAIFASMTSVFLLLAIGIYYFTRALSLRRIAALYPLAIIGVIWVLAFGIYYVYILRYQLGSQYLQNFHEGYFLSYNLTDVDKVNQDQRLLLDLLKMVCGSENSIALYSIGILLIAGISYTAKKEPRILILTLIPILGVFIASLFHSFTLLPRVCIFLVPLALLLATYGLKAIEVILPRLRFIPAFAAFMLAILTVNPGYLLANKLEVDELTTSVDFAKEHGVTMNNIYLQEYVAPSLIYYRNIHPDKIRYRSYSQLHVIGSASTDAEALNRLFILNKQRCAFIYYWIDDQTLQMHREKLYRALTPVDSMIRPGFRVLIFEGQ